MINTPTETSFKKWDTVTITSGVHQGETWEIFDEVVTAGRQSYEIILWGCFPVFISEEFLAPTPTQNESKKEKSELIERCKSRSGKTREK